MSTPVKYIVLDTCVWLHLLKASLESPLNEFDEMLFWIEKGHLVSITCPNLLREWERQKTKQYDVIINGHKMAYNIVKNRQDLQPFTSTDRIKEDINVRIARIEYALKNLSEVSAEPDEIVLQASKRNLNLLAPNHIKESLRDTVNILCIIEHLKTAKYSKCLFTTINHEDFSSNGNRRYEIHPQLKQAFDDVNLEYVFFDGSASSKLFHYYLKPNLPVFEDYLKDQREKAEKGKISERLYSVGQIEVLDSEYIGHLKYIDEILAKSAVSELEKKMLELILNSHASYKQYFLKNVGKDGLV